jgi:hypothetical protein
MGIEEGQRHQQRRILEACDRLEMTGATLELGYSAHPADDSEIISRTMMLNLFETAIEQHCD